MTVFRHELKRGRTAWLIWAAALSLLLAICIFLFPEMASQTDTINEMFASMGSFTSAFGMDKLDFGTLPGYFAIECGNVLGLGGALFASLLAASMLCKEEKERTAEFLLSHPVSRTRVVAEKLAALYAQITALNIAVCLVSVGSMAAVGEEVPWKSVSLLCLACFLLQCELAAVCFGVSAFIRRGSAGIGIGAAILAYFLNIIGNIADSAKFLKYITPFGYCDGAEVVSSGKLDGIKLLVGAAFCALGIAAAFVKYRKKDIA
ncbi:MAG: ABC transporter permease subunit [Clostridia bacterium]|nr:ABC transporter permease subunit [Clostridia bacterium]